MPEEGSAPSGAPTGPTSRGDGNRGRGRGRGRGNRGGPRRGGRGGQQAQHQTRPDETPDENSIPANPAARDVAAAAAKAHMAASAAAAAAAAEAAGDDDAEVCFICANPVAHFSIAPCNHTTCHICGLRMRALYKTKGCAHCRTASPFVIFTDDGEKKYEEYKESEFSTTDGNIGIKYTHEDIVGDTVLLLRYNCPDASCDFAGLGWPDLHRHVKNTHRKRMCDLCTRSKKVFTHEHELFTDKELEKHMKRGDDQPGAADQTGFKGHPLCGFCGERFYDDDKLYEHCRMKHERCFLCDRRDSRSPHYYRDYNALEDHFGKDHYLCKDKECMEKKFVVFESEMDLQAHQLSEHGGKATGRDARLVNISGWDVRESYQPERRGGGRSEGEGRARGRGRGRGRDPNNDMVPPSNYTQPLRRDEIAFQRQMAIQSSASLTPRTFGGQLTAPSASTPASTSRPASGATTPRVPQEAVTNPLETLSLTDTSNITPEERARLVRHGSVIERAANLLGNDSTKMAAFRDNVSSYRQSKLSATQLVDAFFSLFAETSSNALGTLVREVADLFEDKKKADDLRKSWQDWRAINEDYPSLPGLTGMQGSSGSASGWASAAASTTPNIQVNTSQKHSTRVLKLKNSTRLGPAPKAVNKGPPGWVPVTSTNSSSSSSSRPPPSQSSAFPTLAASKATPSSSSSSSSKPSWVGAQPSSSSGNTPRPRGGEDNFPALPQAPKPTTTIFGYGGGRSVRRDYGHKDSGFSWGGGTGNGASGSATPTAVEEADGEETGGKGKKKGKKQVLVQWG